jgi:hypothetical protein
MNTKEWKIKQIVPAQPGWKAIHCGELNDGQLVIFNRAIICWALVEELGANDQCQTQVRGMEQRGDELVLVDSAIKPERLGAADVDAQRYFLGYDDPDGHRESDYWISEAKRRFKQHLA